MTLTKRYENEITAISENSGQHRGRCAGNDSNLYYRWSKDFLEAGKRRLAGNTVREANSDEVVDLKKENTSFKQTVAELYLRNDWLLSSAISGFVGKGNNSVVFFRLSWAPHMSRTVVKPMASISFA